MAAFIRNAAQSRPSAWLDRLELLVASELAPSAEKFRTALRLTTIGTVGAGLVAICHVNSAVGTYLVWLLVGAGPMLPVRKAVAILLAEGLMLAAAVVLARAFAETPWLMLPFLFAMITSFTYVGMTRKLGIAVLLIQVVSLDTFYGVIFAPQKIGWGAAGAFAGTAIALGVVVLFDNWWWPDPGEPILMKSLGLSLAHEASRLIEAAKYYLGESVPRPSLPPATWDLPGHLALLDRVVAEGVTAHRRAVLLAAITRLARIHLDMDRLVIAAREDVPREVRKLLQRELEGAVDAIAAALKQMANEMPTLIRVGVDSPPPAPRVRARSQMDALSARIIEARPRYIRSAGTAEVANLAAFTDCLAALTGLIERLLDDPPAGCAMIKAAQPTIQSGDAPDTALVRYCQKVGLCVVIGYLVGIIAHRENLSTILTTVLITAMPTYGASLRKMILRIVGAVLGGLISLAAIVIVTPNFDTLPVYLITTFIVLYVSAYSSLTSGRVAYAGKQIGTTFVLVFAGLSPSADIYIPLWRTWGILLGTVVVTMVFLSLWPVYAGDSLLPRLRKVIRTTLSLAPGGTASFGEAEIDTANTETMHLLAEILEIATDAEMEGRTSTIDHNSVIQATGTLRRIANRLSSIGIGIVTASRPKLDEPTELSRGAVLAAIRARLQAWLDFLDGWQGLSARAAHSRAASHSREEIARPLGDYSARLNAGGFAQIESWSLEQRRAVLAELQSLRRLDFLISELDRYLSQLPGTASQPPISVTRAARFA